MALPIRYWSTERPIRFPTTLGLLSSKGPQERVADVYAGLCQRVLDQNPGAFVVEYAWSTRTCGEPCVGKNPLNEYELLQLGGDVLERTVRTPWGAVVALAAVGALVAGRSRRGGCRRQRGHARQGGCQCLG